MDINQIKSLIELLPTLIIYLVPGYIMIVVYNFTLTKSNTDTKNTLIKSIVLSYIIINLIKFILPNNFINLVSPEGILLLVFSAVIITYIFDRMLTSSWFRKVLNFLDIYETIQEDVLNNIIDKQNGNWFRVYIPSENIIYNGKLRFNEKSKDKGQFIVLSNYSSYSYYGVELENFEDNNEKWVMISTNNISRTEITFHPNSQIIK